MKNRIFIKIIGFALCIVIVATHISTAVATDNGRPFTHTDHVIHYQRLGERGVAEQVAEIGGSIFYFVVTDEYAYSSQLTPCGIYNFAFSYIDSNVIVSGILSKSALLDTRCGLYSDNGDTIDISLLMSSIVLNDLYSFATDTTIFEIVLHESVKNEYVGMRESPFSPRSETFPPYSSLTALTNNEFHTYSNLFLGSRTETRGGVRATATVNENHTVWSSADRSWWIGAGTTIASIAVLVIAPASVLINIISVTIIGVGIIQTAVSLTLGRTNLNQRFARIVRVNADQIWYFAAYDIVWHVFSGNLGWDINRSQAVSRNRHWDFNNVSLLSQTGLNNFFHSIGIW